MHTADLLHLCVPESSKQKERKESRAVAEELTLLCCPKCRQSVNGDYQLTAKSTNTVGQRAQQRSEASRRQRRGNWSQIKQINKPITSESYDLFLLIECSRTFF